MAASLNSIGIEYMTPAAPSKRGLYDPQWEHDACGIGAVVNISGRRDHAIVEYGKQVLLNLMHRGAAGADESTGDGAGILLQIPHGFFRAVTGALGFQLPDPKQYGVAMLFLAAGRGTPPPVRTDFRRVGRRRGFEVAGLARRAHRATAAWAIWPERPSR